MGIDRSSSGSGEIIRPETGAYATEIGGLSDIPQKVQNDFHLWILVSVGKRLLSDACDKLIVGNSNRNQSVVEKWVSMVQFAQYLSR